MCFVDIYEPKTDFKSCLTKGLTSFFNIFKIDRKSFKDSKFY